MISEQERARARQAGPLVHEGWLVFRNTRKGVYEPMYATLRGDQYDARAAAALVLGVTWKQLHEAGYVCNRVKIVSEDT